MAPQNSTIGFFARKNPFTDHSEWSGCVHYVCRAIESRGFNVKWIPYNPGKWSWQWLNLSRRVMHGPHTKVRQLEEYAKICARSVDDKLLYDCDCLFFPGGGEMIRYLNISKPSIYLVDATYRIMLDYYYAHQSAGAVRNSERRASATYSSCSRIIAASRWAARSLVDDYGVDPGRVSVIEFGACIDDDDVRYVRRSWKKGDVLRIFFSGVEWGRKGGDIAVETVSLLRKKGFDARLNIAGIRKLPDRYQRIPFIDDVGFLSKNNPEEFARYISLFEGSHLFLLPTRAECAGMVFCEASAFGLPSITYDTGGVGDYVVDGFNGYRLPLSAGPRDFADRIESIITGGTIGDISAGARKMYVQRLNWSKWGEDFERLVSDL